MIRYWKVKNFKSFRDPPSIALSQINVIAGANSSGKSTILQSILLLKQTLQYGAENRQLILNGPLLRLGAFDDIKHAGSGTESLQIEFEVEPGATRHSGIRASSWVQTLRRHSSVNDSPKRIRLQLQFDTEFSKEEFTPLTGYATLNPRLLSMTLSSLKDGSDDPDQRNFISYELTSNEDDALSLGSQFKIGLDNQSHNDVCGKKPQAKVVGGFTSHFLPQFVTVKYNATAAHAIELADAIFTDPAFTTLPGGDDEIIPEEAVQLVNAWLSDHQLDLLTGEEGFVTARQMRDTFSPMFRQVKGLFGLSLKNTATEAQKTELLALRDAFLGKMLTLDNEISEDYELELPQVASISTRYLTEYLKSGVKYLGPLRDSPRPVYQPEALESTTDVGYRGEHTAAVLDLNGHKSISFHLPPKEDDLTDYYENAAVKRSSLAQAVKLWLRYLGVAHDVRTLDVGVYGNRLQVTTSDDDQTHDLTNVGVGVSQVLPIVVMALLSQPGSLLIFEQPELHLHPKVQARLADFFIALAKDGKQTLLETHSEYLVDRLRLRIALSETDRTANAVNILFSRKVGQESQLSSIKVNEYGAVENWPEDFFEQSQKDVSRILKAAAAKRRRISGRI